MCIYPGVIQSDLEVWMKTSRTRTSLYNITPHEHSDGEVADELADPSCSTMNYSAAGHWGEHQYLCSS